MYSSQAVNFITPHMGSYLIVEQVTDLGRSEIGRLQGGEVSVGREPGQDGFVVDSSAVSRVHGNFVRYRNHWFYRDLGSTNGSWVNGVKVGKNQYKLIRAGDVIQLGDAALHLVDAETVTNRSSSFDAFPSVGGRSLVVFQNGEFLDEYPIPEYGRALVIGGSNPDLELDGDLFELPSLVIERRGDHISVYSVQKEVPIYINDGEMLDAHNLSDNDEIRISSYTIIFNDPANSRLRNNPKQSTEDDLSSASNPDGSLALAGSETQGIARQSAKIARKSLFGKALTPEEETLDQTFALDLSELEGRYHPGMRSSIYNQPQNASSKDNLFTSLEDKIIIGLGFVLLIGLIVVVLWWALK